MINLQKEPTINSMGFVYVGGHKMFNFGRMWIGQGKPTMAERFRFVRRILTF